MAPMVMPEDILCRLAPAPSWHPEVFAITQKRRHTATPCLVKLFEHLFPTFSEKLDSKSLQVRPPGQAK